MPFLGYRMVINWNRGKKMHLPAHWLAVVTPFQGPCNLGSCSLSADSIRRTAMCGSLIHPPAWTKALFSMMENSLPRSWMTFMPSTGIIRAHVGNVGRNKQQRMGINRVSIHISFSIIVQFLLKLYKNNWFFHKHGSFLSTHFRNYCDKFHIKHCTFQGQEPLEKNSPYSWRAFPWCGKMSSSRMLRWQRPLYEKRIAPSDLSRAKPEQGKNVPDQLSAIVPNVSNGSCPKVRPVIHALRKIFTRISIETYKATHTRSRVKLFASENFFIQ